MWKAFPVKTFFSSECVASLLHFILVPNSRLAGTCFSPVFCKLFITSHCLGNSSNFSCPSLQMTCLCVVLDCSLSLSLCSVCLRGFNVQNPSNNCDTINQFLNKLQWSASMCWAAVQPSSSFLCLHHINVHKIDGFSPCRIFQSHGKRPYLDFLTHDLSVLFTNHQ